MHSLVEQHLDELRRICKSRRVLRLDLFGSAATGSLHQSSDLDFLVEFEGLCEGEFADAYFGLLEDLQRLFARPVDLVMISAIRNPYFKQAIEPQRTLLYAA